jgi:hypothetical protein
LLALTLPFSVSGNGLRSDDDGAVITDSPLLTSNSYVVLKHFNSSLVDFTYLDGKGDHMDIVWALFGYLPFKLNVTGDLQSTKLVLNLALTCGMVITRLKAIPLLPQIKDW